MFTIAISNLVNLCTLHINRFENLLTKAQVDPHSNVRVSECEHYLSIWKQGREWAQTQPPERVVSQKELQTEVGPRFVTEVYDAWQEGSYHEHFKGNP